MNGGKLYQRTSGLFIDPGEILKTKGRASGITEDCRESIKTEVYLLPPGSFADVVVTDALLFRFSILGTGIALRYSRIV